MIVLDVHLPAKLADNPSLPFCVPGGGVNRDYFDAIAFELPEKRKRVT